MSRLSELVFKVPVFGAKHDDRGALERRQRLAQASGREQAFVKIAAVKDDDVHVAREPAMLEAVVEQMNTGEQVHACIGAG